MSLPQTHPSLFSYGVPFHVAFGQFLLLRNRRSWRFPWGHQPSRRLSNHLVWYHERHSKSFSHLFHLNQSTKRRCRFAANSKGLHHHRPTVLSNLLREKRRSLTLRLKVLREMLQEVKQALRL